MVDYGLSARLSENRVTDGARQIVFTLLVNDCNKSLRSSGGKLNYALLRISVHEQNSAHRGTYRNLGTRICTERRAVQNDKKMPHFSRSGKILLRGPRPPCAGAFSFLAATRSA